jgi:hypothetical protein
LKENSEGFAHVATPRLMKDGEEVLQRPQISLHDIIALAFNHGGPVVVKIGNNGEAAEIKYL